MCTQIPVVLMSDATIHVLLDFRNNPTTKQMTCMLFNGLATKTHAFFICLSRSPKQPLHQPVKPFIFYIALSKIALQRSEADSRHFAEPVTSPRGGGLSCHFSRSGAVGAPPH